MKNTNYRELPRYSVDICEGVTAENNLVFDRKSEYMLTEQTPLDWI